MEEKCGPLTFFSNFDSGNLSKVEQVELEGNEQLQRKENDIHCDYEYNAWTCPDCHGTPFENGNRTWFYFGIKGGQGGKTVKINIVNMNKQGKLYSQGMTPVVKVVPSREAKWERVRNRITHQVIDGQFILTFTYTFPEIKNATIYFAFCYPYSYKECQKKLAQLDKEYLQCDNVSADQRQDNSIYYHRELLCNSLEGLRVDLITISSIFGMRDEKEKSIPGIFPDVDDFRANKFDGKKVFFVSSRVHPGETPASFVFNGFIDFILRRNDPRAAMLRDKFVFKLIPMLNPDGVYRGYYRTDTRGVNLNRVYLDPDPTQHPSVFAVKCLTAYYHSNGRNVCFSEPTTDHVAVESQLTNSPSELLLKTDLIDIKGGSREPVPTDCDVASSIAQDSHTENLSLVDHLNELDLKPPGIAEEKQPTHSVVDNSSQTKMSPMSSIKNINSNNEPFSGSGLALYIDLHGHASKRGCFIYANNFEKEDDQVDCLLFPKIMSINSPNFDFNACNFSLKNMHTKDKRDGMSKEGSGRVAISKATGLLRSYTLECNYNSGRITNTVPPASNDNGRATPPPIANYPPKYTPDIYAEVGRALAISALDLFEINPWSRILASEFHTFSNLKSWLLSFVQQTKAIRAFQKTNGPGTTKNTSRAPAISSSILKPRAAAQITCKIRNSKPEKGAKASIVRRERNLQRKISLSKNDARKSSQLLTVVDAQASSTLCKVIQLQPRPCILPHDNPPEIGKQVPVKQDDCSSKPKRNYKFQMSCSSSRSQISKLTLSLDPSRIPRPVTKSYSGHFLVKSKASDENHSKGITARSNPNQKTESIECIATHHDSAKKEISEEVAKRVVARRTKSSNEMRNARKQQFASDSKIHRKER